MKTSPLLEMFPEQKLESHRPLILDTRILCFQYVFQSLTKPLQCPLKKGIQSDDFPVRIPMFDVPIVLWL